MAAQHPLVNGSLAKSSQQLFKQELFRIFDSNQVAVMPIEISQDSLNKRAYFSIQGYHWIGMVVKPQTNGFLIEIIDPAASLLADQILTYPDQPGLSLAIKRLLTLLQATASDSVIDVHVIQLATLQQAGDLDCGPWTVDNLHRRAKGLPLRTRNEIQGQALRDAHDEVYIGSIRPGN